METASFNSLPVEILFKIFKLFDYKQVLAASLVSQKWLAVSQTYGSSRKLKMFIQTEEQMKSLIKSKRHFVNLIFGYNPQYDLLVYKEFWKTFADTIQYVCLDGIKNLYVIIDGLSKLSNLKTLDFRNSKYFDEILHCDTTDDHDDLPVLNISTLLMDAQPYYEYMKDGEMGYILSVIPKLEKLVIRTTSICKDLIKYLQNPEVSSSLRHILITFTDDLMYSNEIKTFFLDLIEIKHFNLETLHYSFDPDNLISYNLYERREIINFVVQQKNLKDLKISGIDLPAIFSTIFPKLPNIEEVEFEIMNPNSIDELTLPSLMENFKTMWKLKRIKFYLHHQGIEYPVFETLNEPSELTYLSIWAVGPIKGLTILEQKLRFLPNLTSLSMQCGVIMNSFVQIIFVNLVSLRKLNLEAEYTPIRDSFITGEYEADFKTFSISNLKYLEDFSICGDEGKSELTDSSLKHLVELKFLRRLNLNIVTKFTDGGLNDFRKISNANLILKE